MIIKTKLKAGLMLALIITLVAGTLFFSPAKALDQAANSNTSGSNSNASARGVISTLSTVWNGETATNYAGGDGTQNNPYIIENASQLDLLRKNTNDIPNYSNGLHFRLTANILLNDTQNFQNWQTTPPTNVWIPIGTSDNPFKGTFDGAGYNIEGIYINYNTLYQGLFGSVGGGLGSALIQNVGVTKSYIKANNNVGGIAGALNNAKILNSFFNNSALIGTGGNVGGIAGSLNNSEITNCYNAGGSSGSSLVGRLENSRLKNSYHLVGSAVGSHAGENIITDVLAFDSSGIFVSSESVTVGGTSFALALDALNAWVNLNNTTDYIYGNWNNTETHFGLIFAWDGSIATAFAGGDGTELSPYLIATPAQLALLSYNVKNTPNYSSGKHFKLVKDIALNDTTNHEDWKDGENTDNLNQWTPIGTYTQGFNSYSFYGIFYGDNHKVTGIYINNNDDYQGLFGALTMGIIKNVGIEDSFIKGGKNVGGIAGRIMLAAKIENCFNAAYVSGGRYDTGDDEYNVGSNVGGIVGLAEGTIEHPIQFVPEISNSYNLGTVADTHSTKALGGIVGYIKDSKIFNCFNVAEINTTSGYVGGIAGYAQGAGIANCYNTGGIAADYGAGGIAGVMYNASIENCYNSGAVYASENLGALVGFGKDSTLGHSYYLDSNNPGLFSVSSAAIGEDSENVTTASVHSFDLDGNLSLTIDGFKATNLTDALNAWIVATRSENTQYFYYEQSGSLSQFAPDKVYHFATLDFNSGNFEGEGFIKYLVLNNNLIAHPVTPTRNGYALVGWVVGTQLVMPSTYKITQNTTIRAAWALSAPSVTLEEQIIAEYSSLGTQITATLNEPEDSLEYTYAWYYFSAESEQYEEIEDESSLTLMRFNVSESGDYKLVATVTDGEMSESAEFFTTLTITPQIVDLSGLTAQNREYNGTGFITILSGENVVEYLVDKDENLLEFAAFVQSITASETVKDVIITLTGEGIVSENYNILYDLTVIISKAFINKPTPETTAFEYNLESQSVLESNLIYTVTGGSATVVGDYAATISLIDTENSMWADETTDDITVLWSIYRLKITMPTAPLTSLVYSGNELNYPIAESMFYQISNSKATLAGDYTATVTLVDKDNLEWQDGTTADLRFDFSVAKGKNKGDISLLDLKVESYTNKSVTLNVIEGAQYSKDGGETWQDSNVFENLKTKKEYTFIARFAGDDNFEPSIISQSVKATPKNPPLPLTAILAAIALIAFLICVAIIAVKYIKSKKKPE